MGKVGQNYNGWKNVTWFAHPARENCYKLSLGQYIFWLNVSLCSNF